MSNTFAPSRLGGLTSRQRAGLVIAGIFSLLNIPFAFIPIDTDGDQPPPLIAAIATVLGLLGVVAAIVAWRGSRVALRVCAGAIIVSTLTGLPALFVDVPMWVKALVAASVLICVACTVLMFSGPRRRSVTD